MKTQSFPKLFMYVVLCCVVLVTFSLMTGCKGDTGAAGTSAPTTGTVSGTVVTKVGNVPLAGVSVTSNPTVTGGTATTAADGSYSLSLPGGSYTLTFSKTNYTTATANVNVANGVQTPSNATMAEAASGAPSVVLTASGNDVGYGQSFTVTASATSPLGLSLTYTWTGATGSGTTATATSQTLASALGGTTNQNDVPAFVQEARFGILPINADTRGTKTVSVTVSDGQGGSTSASVTVNSAAPQSGVRQVATGIPVFLNSGVKDDAATTWTLTQVPATSSLTATSIVTTGTTTRNPWFTPDVEGAYVVTTGTGSNITIYAGKFVGAISGGTDVTTTITSTMKNLWSSMWLGTVPTGVSSVTFTNWPTVTANSACSGCHNNSIAPNVFAEWKNTVHATFFARGLEGITSNSGSCVACHTAGADGVNAGNGGYDDAVAATGFVYQKGVGAWTALTQSYPSVAKMASIQCENCHGAQSTLADPDSGHESAAIGGATAPTAARISYSSDVCGQCHASGTGHHNYSEWINSINPDSKMGHSKLAQINATGYSGHARSTDGSCVRCHTAQGFAAYVPQLLSGNAGTVPSNVITWTPDNAQVQTCVACHDPHSDVNENQLRIVDSLPTSMGGFGVNGVGKGALCMACHNNRNGIQCATAPTSTGLCPGGALSPTGATFLHEDGDANAALINDSMHDASQAEVLMGRDFFFMGNSLPMISKHANVEDTCVGCHMALNPQTHSSHGALAVSGHLFYIKDADVATLCANCHGNGTVDGEALQTFVEDQLTVLGNAISANLLGRVQGQTIYVNYYPSGQPAVHTALVVDGSTTVTYYDGSFCFNGTFSGSTCSSGSSYKASLANITTDAAGTQPVFGPNDRLKKASWNWTMIDRDGSKGIHNPTLVTTVLNNTIAAMSTLAP